MDEKKLQKIRTLMIVFRFFLVQAFLFSLPLWPFPQPVPVGVML